MDQCCFYTAGQSPALGFAAAQLAQAGCRFSSAPSPEVTHLLLPVPSLDSNLCIRGGCDLQAVLALLPPSVCVVGGKLPPLSQPMIDLLEDPDYTAENGFLTAHCALSLAMARLPIPWRGTPVLVIGWGQIGKCLARLLQALEAQVTVAVRKSTDRAVIRALGYRAVPIEGLSGAGYRVIFNTVPAWVLPEGSPDALKFELASTPGLGGQDVIRAAGLPGKHVPEAAGALMARRIIHHINKEAGL